MNRISILLPNRDDQVWADDAAQGLIGQQTTVLDLQGVKHDGKIVNATTDDHGIEIVVETDAALPGADGVLGLSIGDATLP